MFHHEGELAVARAARRARLPYGVSTLATQPLEAIADAAQGSPLWFQLYLWGDRSASRELVARARVAGYRALLLSADTTVRSERDRELHRGVELPTPELTLRTVLDGARHPAWSWHFLTSPAPDFPNLAGQGSTSRGRMREMFDGTVSWKDLEWIRQEWDGPIAVKGILRAEEAVRAADEGVDAVIVSNHGGRQLDRVPATLEVLPDIVDAVGDRVEVLFGSGIRRGTDVVTALALGAQAVLADRAHLYGLAAAGQAGVRYAIDILDQELHRAMALCGAAGLADLDRDLLRVSGPPRTAPARGRRPSTAADNRFTASGSAGPVGLPFDQYGGGVVAQPAVLVAEDRVVEPTHRLRCRQAGAAAVPCSGPNPGAGAAPETRPGRWCPRWCTRRRPRRWSTCASSPWPSRAPSACRPGWPARAGAAHRAVRGRRAVLTEDVGAARDGGARGTC